MPVIFFVQRAPWRTCIVPLARAIARVFPLRMQFAFPFGLAGRSFGSQNFRLKIS
jgi:hypothetical protein